MKLFTSVLASGLVPVGAMTSPPAKRAPQVPNVPYVMMEWLQDPSTHRSKAIMSISRTFILWSIIIFTNPCFPCTVVNWDRRNGDFIFLWERVYPIFESKGTKKMDHFYFKIRIYINLNWAYILSIIWGVVIYVSNTPVLSRVMTYKWRFPPNS